MNGKDKETITFQPHLSMNDFAGLLHALLTGVGIGDFPPLVRPELLRERRLVEGYAQKAPLAAHSFSSPSRQPTHITHAVRLFGEFAAEMAPQLSFHPFQC